jgi:hypothetical protein
MREPVAPAAEAGLADSGQRWMALMRRGDWEAAWRLSDAALRDVAARRHPGIPRHLQAVWDGSEVAGRRVLVRCYHGLGDTIHFIRLLPRLRALAAGTAVWAQPVLLPLLRTMPGVGPLLPLHDGAPEAGFEVDVEIMELAHLLRITPATLPAKVPYLFPPLLPRESSPRPGRESPPRLGRDFPPRLGREAPPLAVGLVWQAGNWDPRRSIPPALLLPLARIPGIALHLLQRGEALRAAPPGLGSVAGSDDVLRAASLMTALDLVISVDSMPAHLAGALGVPVWTLLAHEADWRWMEGREDSPWYPTMRLFRQPAPGAWPPVIEAVAAALRDAAAARTEER